MPHVRNEAARTVPPLLQLSAALVVLHELRQALRVEAL
jgi:hypothetical protein